MAVTEIITLQTDTTGAVTGIEEVSTAMENLDTATLNAGEATKSLRTQIRDATNELNNMTEDDPRRAKLIADIGTLRDRMADNAEQIRQQTGPAVEGLNNSFGIMQGQMLNLDFAGLATSLQGVATNIGRINTAEIIQGLKNMLNAGVQVFTALAEVIITNPIFLIGATIGTVYLLWDDLTKAVKNYNLTQEEAVKGMMKSDVVLKEMQGFKIQEAQIELLVRAVNDHTKSEEEREVALAKVNEALKANGMAAIDDINSTAQIINSKNLLIAKLQQEAKVRGKMKYLEELYARQAQENNDKNFATQISMANDYALKQLDLQDSWVARAYDISNSWFGTTVTQMKDTQKEIDFITQDIYNDQQALDALQIKNIEKVEKKKTETHRTARKERKKENEQDLLAELEEWERAKEREIDMTAEIESEGAGKSLKMREIDFSSQMSFANKKIELKKVETKTLEEIEAKAEDIRRARIKKEMDFRIEQTAEALTVLSDLNDTFLSRNDKVARKQFAVSKALNMAAAIMNTYGAVNKALNDETMPSTAARIVQAVIVGATGFANVAKIAKTQYSSTNTGGGGGGGFGNMSAGGGNMPTAPAVDFGFLQQTGQPNTVETYVLAGNVANALEARQKIIDQSYL